MEGEEGGGVLSKACSILFFLIKVNVRYEKNFVGKKSLVKFFAERTLWLKKESHLNVYLSSVCD